MLLDTIADILPMAAGIALSPIPIAAVVSILLAADSGKALAFLCGWSVGILVIAALVLLAFTVIASLSVAVPIGFTWARPNRARELLEDLKDWLIVNNTTVTVTLLVVFAVLIVGSGLKIVF